MHAYTQRDTCRSRHDPFFQISCLTICAPVYAGQPRQRAQRPRRAQGPVQERAGDFYTQSLCLHTLKLCRDTSGGRALALLLLTSVRLNPTGPACLCSHQGDFMKLPFPENHFDGVYAIEATCHAPDRTKVRRLPSAHFHITGMRINGYGHQLWKSVGDPRACPKPLEMDSPGRMPPLTSRCASISQCLCAVGLLGDPARAQARPGVRVLRVVPD